MLSLPPSRRPCSLSSEEIKKAANAAFRNSRELCRSPYFGGSVDEGLVAGAADFVPMPAGRELPVVGREAEGAAGTPDW